MKFRAILLSAMAALMLIFAAGCARFPVNPVPITGRQLIITVTVAGEINPNYYYYVAFDTSGAMTPGPLPVVAIPWGNGWGTGNISNYVIFHTGQPFGGYALYRFTNPELLFPQLVGNGSPVSWVTPPPGANTLQFTIDLGQLATAALPADQIDQININFITTDVVPLDPNAPVRKLYDGLGVRGNEFITIQTATSQVYNNSQTNLEFPGDVVLPDLDIIDWSVEVQQR
jgi:hypothetical protein